MEDIGACFRLWKSVENSIIHFPYIILIQEKIHRVQISVYDHVRMQELDSFTHINGHLKPLRESQNTMISLQVVKEGSTMHVLWNQGLINLKTRNKIQRNEIFIC